MSLYACTSCGSVRTDDDRCYVCGGEDFDGVDVGSDGHVCDECGRSFDNAQGLASHSRVHDEE